MVFLCGMIVGIFQLGMEIRFFYITFIILSIYPVKAQNSYSLNFDGEDDYVEVPYGSAMISNAGQIALSRWVYPRNTNYGWPDFDAFFVSGMNPMLISIFCSLIITKWKAG